MKHFVFKLSMPNVGSWNGKWSGKNRFYGVVRSYKDNECENILKQDYHYYDFEDGWGAGVRIEQIEATQKNKLRKLSKGFCGYEWMIDEIEQYGRILKRKERHLLEKKLS